MRLLWRLTVGAVLVLALGACSGGDDGDAGGDAGTTSTGAPSVEDSTTTTPPDETTASSDETSLPAGGGDGAPVAASSDFPCDLVATGAVEAIAGTPLTDGDDLATTNTRNEATWTSRKCTWEDEASDQEVALDVALADGFASGVVECIEPLSDATTVDGPGDQNFWEWDGLLDQAALQVCTADALLEISFETWPEDDEAGALAAATTLAEEALSALG